MQSMLSIVVLVVAAVFEVSGDAIIRRGMQGGGIALIVLGAAILAAYGIVVNFLGWDFSRLLGVYVAVFATAAVLAGRFLFHETVPISTWTGLAVIVLGGLIIQYGPSLSR